MKKPSKDKCPVCKKESHKDFAPFCSKRCSQVDLGRWLGGNYVIPADEVPSSDDLGI